MSELEAITVDKAELTRLRKSLEAAGFTDEGGELWKPPVRNVGIIDEVDRLRRELEEKEGQLCRAKELISDFPTFAYTISNDEWRAWVDGIATLFSSTTCQHKLEVDVLEGKMQTALDLLVESESKTQSYDFNARRGLFIEAELRQRRKR